MNCAVELLLLDDQLRDAGLLRARARTGSTTAARALSRLMAAMSPAGRRDAVGVRGRRSSTRHPNRFFRLSRPTFCNVATMVLMMIVGCPSDRYCTRQVTVLPLPFGVTSQRPV